MKNQRKRLLALVAMVLICTMVLPLFGCGKEEPATTTAEEVVQSDVDYIPATSKTPVATKSDPNAESLQSTPNKGGNKKVTSGTTSVKSQFSISQEELARALQGLAATKARTLVERRNYAEAYMRAMLTVEWTLEDRPETQLATSGGKTFYRHDYDTEEAWLKAAGTTHLEADDYTYKVGSYTFPLKSGRTYRGLPYSNGDCGLETFYLFKKSSQNGVSVMDSRFDVVYLYGGHAIARIGNTAETALIYAWNTISPTSRAQSVIQMVPTNGYLFGDGLKIPELTEEQRKELATKPPIDDGVMVGAGVAKKLDLTYDRSLSGDTDEIVAHNGEQGMYSVYAKAMKSDGLIRSDGSTDAKMVVSVTVKKNEDGTINGDESFVTVLAQTHTLFQNQTTDEDGVYLIGEVDRKMSFKELYENNYITMTVAELRDGTASIDGAMVRDAYEYASRRTGAYMYSGVINGSRRILWVNAVLVDTKTGKTIYDNVALAERGDVKIPASTETGRYTFDLSKLDDSHELIISLGSDVVANAALEAGTYHYTLTARLITGEDVVVRDYEFEKAEATK